MRRVALSLACLIGLLGLVGLLAWADGSRPQEIAPASASSGSGDSSVDLSPPRGRGSAESNAVASTPPSHRTPRSVAIYTTTVALSTYPYADCLLPPQIGVASVSYRALDWGCLSGAGPPVSQTFTLLVLSNDYLTLTLLPELGGRLYELIFRPTGHNEFYRNPVLKPAPWGPEGQGWWLAAGGLEWGFPTDEHGYEWGIPWHYQVVTSAVGVTVTLRDTNVVTRPSVSVAVHLPADRASLVIRPKIINPTPASVGLKFWANAMLAPGAPNAPSGDLRFLFPSDQVTVHSTGDANLPPGGQLMDWPVHRGRDYSRLGNWDQWLGFFEAPHAHGPFAGVYDASADEGVMRVYPAAVTHGSKGFAFGWNDPLPSSLWTDDGSAYVELQGGLAPTFWDVYTLAPGEVVSWTEVWYPLAGVGGVSTATEEAALRLERIGDELALGLYTPAAHENVDLYLWQDDCAPLAHRQLARIGPAQPVRFSVPASGLTSDALSLVAFAADGALLGGINPRDCVPPVATVEPLPLYVTTPTFTVAWRGEETWSGIAGYDVQFRVGYEGDWVNWLTGTAAVSATFTGEHSQTYFFRARARDNAGNVGAFERREWGQAFTSVLLTPSPVLVTSRKLVAPLAPTVARPVTCTVLLSNTGNLTANSLVLTDHLPATLTLISGTLYADEGSLLVPSEGVITWRGALPPGREFRMTYALSATAVTPLGVPLTNTLLLVADGLAPLVRRATITYRHAVYLPLITVDPISL